MQRLLVLPALTWLVACGTDSVPPTQDPPAAEPVYYGEVQRILNERCVECHSADPDRLAPFSLATYDDAAAAAADLPMAYAVMNRIMPPYYANQDGECHTFPDAHWLTPDEMDTLVGWINGARLEGDPANTVAPPPPRGGLADVDETLDLGTYTPVPLPDEAVDVYRCFVLDGLAADTFVQGVHVRPGNASIVHHVILFTLPSAEAEADVIARGAAGPYRCDGGPTPLGADFLAGWAPGTDATPFPASTGIAVTGGRKLVVQIHYNLANSDGAPDGTQIDLDTTPSVTSQARIVSVAGDVDLPKMNPDAIASGEVRLPAQLASARVWGAAIHMHQRGTKAEVERVAASADSCLLDLDAWSFHWQHFYWYASPVEITGGDTLRVRCHYDTTGDTGPGNITWGEETTDEMCLAYLYMSL